MQKASSSITNEQSMLLSRSFAKDPWICKLFSNNSTKAQKFFTFVIRYCECIGGKVFVDFQESKLTTVACLEYPKTRVSLRKAFTFLTSLVSYLRACGLKPFRLMNAYMRATTQLRPNESHYYLICIGVAPESIGIGIGKKMLNTLHEIVDSDSSSIGIALDTENPNNIALYEHFGYTLTGTVKLDEITIYSLFRLRKIEIKN